MSFSGHGQFFSRELHLELAVDPEAFVQDGQATAGQGPGGVAHVDEFDPPAWTTNPKRPVLYDSQGNSLEFTLARWLAASGSATIARSAAGSHIDAAFAHVIAFGEYSLFLAEPSIAGTIFTPLDGDGSSNTFTADGAGTGVLAIDAPHRLPAHSAIVVVYHSDDVDHGSRVARSTLTLTSN
ncbi:MAG: hypothetical protein ABI346_05205 [Candidatus Baltobacteraceae bacterium]